MRCLLSRFLIFCLLLLRGISGLRVPLRTFNSRGVLPTRARILSESGPFVDQFGQDRPLEPLRVGLERFDRGQCVHQSIHPVHLVGRHGLEGQYESLGAIVSSHLCSKSKGLDQSRTMEDQFNVLPEIEMGHRFDLHPQCRKVSGHQDLSATASMGRDGREVGSSGFTPSVPTCDEIPSLGRAFDRLGDRDGRIGFVIEDEAIQFFA